MVRRAGCAAGVILPGLSGPVWAECTSGGCYDGLAQFLLAVAGYGLVAIILLVLLLVRPWRRMGLRGLALAAALAVGVPLLSQGWQRVQSWWMERGEVARDLPAMSQRTPLLVAEDWTCESGLCAAVLQGRGVAGVLALPIGELEQRDTAAPLVLADLPLELWTRGEGGTVRRRVLGATERAEAAARIDYLILATPAWYRNGPGPLERGIALGQGVLVRLGMAPIAAGPGQVALDALDFDHLDLVLTRRALAVPLAPGNWTTLWNEPLDPEAVARSLCGSGAGGPDWACLDAAGR